MMTGDVGKGVVARSYRAPEEELVGLVENVDVFSTRTTTYDCRQATRGRERGAMPGMLHRAECTSQRADDITTTDTTRQIPCHYFSSRSQRLGRRVQVPLVRSRAAGVVFYGPGARSGVRFEGQEPRHVIKGVKHQHER
jgi:hypothetical protein